MRGRNGLLLAVSTLLGPLFGVLTFGGAGTVIDAFAGGGTSSLGLLVNNWPVVLMGGYVLGIAPGLAFSIAMALLGPRLQNRRTRLAAAPILGAVLSVLLLSTALFGFSLSAIDPGDMLMLCLTGAVAGFISMLLVEWLRPLPVDPVR